MGRPPILHRLEALDQEIAAQRALLGDLAAKMQDIEQRLAVFVETQAKAIQHPKEYESQFNVWPTVTNGIR